MDAVLKTRQLGVRFNKHTILSDINLSFSKARIYALCGANGCGKSTLLQALIGLQNLSEGVVELHQKAIESYPPKERAQYITLLAQAHQAVPEMTVAQLIACGRYSHESHGKQARIKNQEIVDQAIGQLQLQPFANRYLNELSGGQQQRAWLAMALAQQAGILLLDEPTTYLDIHHQLEVLASVRRLSRDYGLTVIWVLHDLNQAAAFSDEIILLKEGRVFCQDTPEKVMQPALLEAAFGVEMPRLSNASTPVCLPDYAAYLKAEQS